MKKLGIPAVLTLLLALAFGAARATAADSTVTILNDSKTTATVSILWSGGGLSPLKIGPGESAASTVPSAIDSVKVQVTGKCRDAVETFNPQRVTRATLRCKGDTYTLLLSKDVPAPQP
jgi:hypothetical protein